MASAPRPSLKGEVESANNQGERWPGKKDDGHIENASYATLEKKLKETKSDFFAALGEAETFQQLMSDYPELKPGITLDYRDAHERSSRLLGNVSALEKALHRLGAP